MGSVKHIHELVVNLHGFEYCVFIWETGKSRITYPVVTYVIKQKNFLMILCLMILNNFYSN